MNRRFRRSFVCSDSDILIGRKRVIGRSTFTEGFRNGFDTMVKCDELKNVE
jgi:hypothetical protein